MIQGIGAIPAQLQQWGVDFAMADGHKWLLGSEGSGFLYVRRSRLDLLRPLQPGWNSDLDTHRPALADVRGTVRSDRSPAGRSGIVAVGFGLLDVRILAQQLRQRGFACSARSGALRVSPHGYNAPGGIDELAKTLRTLTRSG